jgi:membrane protein
LPFGPLGDASDVATAVRRARARRGASGLVSGISAAFVEHNLLTYAAAIAFQALIALVPLVLLALGLLGAFGMEDVWRDAIAKHIRGRVTPPVFHGIDYTGRRIVQHGDVGLIAFASVLSIWYLTAAVRAIMEALDRIHDVKDRRPWLRRAAIAVALALVTCVGSVGSVLLVAAAPRADGAAGVALGIVRWIVAVIVVAVIVGLLVRFAPAEHPGTKWASAGSLLVVVSWLVATELFRLWIQYVANFKTPVGSLLGLLVLTGYLFVSATVFIVGVQLDELLRKRRRGERA